MPPIRARRQFTIVDIANDRARARLKRKGLSHNLINIEAIEKALHEKNDDIPDIVIIDEHTDMLIAQVLKNSQRAPENTRESTPAVTSPVAGKLATGEKPTGLSDTQAGRNLQLAQNNKAPSNQEDEVSNRIQQNVSDTPDFVLKDIGSDKHREFPLELRAIIQVEEQRAAQMTANLKSCTLAINGVQMALSTSAPDSNKEFNEGLLTYLRAAIAQFLANGTRFTPPVLPPKPKSNHQTVSHQQNKLSKIDSRTPEKTITVENSWLTIARKGHQASSQNKSVTEPTLLTAKEIVKYTKSFESDERLFLRLPKDHEWRLLAPSGIREAVSSLLKCSPADIIHVRRTPTGFALTPKDKDTRFRLLDGSVALSVQNVKLEPASDLVTYHIATVPVAIASVNKKVPVTNSMLEAEIKRVTHSSPNSVRPHGKTKLGAPYQSWRAHFPRSQAPRPGFRLFDESGVAIIHKPRQPLQQCKRCLDFHPTRGCSRAPAYGNCSSTMHDISECKALTRCRNCGGPHRSDNRICLARPTRSGPINKEQLLTIRQMSQREFHAVARAKAAVKRAEAVLATQESLNDTASTVNTHIEPFSWFGSFEI